MSSDKEALVTRSSDGENALATPCSDEETPSSTSTDSEDSTTRSPATTTTLKPRTVPQSDWHFAFGPQRWYWVRVGTKWRFVRSSASDWSDISIQDPYWAAFKHTTGFFVGGEDDNGEPETYHTWNDGHMVRASDIDNFVETREAYRKLHDWLDSKHLKDTSVSIGPKGSYFARCGSSWISHGLPKDLQKKLDRNKDEFTPIHVALGLHGSWIVLWSDGDLSWNLRSSYPGLAGGESLKGGVGQVTFVALNPYEEDNYFIMGDNGCHFNVDMCSVDHCDDLQKMMDDYWQMKSKRDGTTYNYPVRIGGRIRNVYITPDKYECRPENTLLKAWEERRSIFMQRENMAIIGAVTVGAGMGSRLTGTTTLRAIGLAGITGMTRTIAMLYDIDKALREAQLPESNR